MDETANDEINASESGKHWLSSKLPSIICCIVNTMYCHCSGKMPWDFDTKEHSMDFVCDVDVGMLEFDVGGIPAENRPY